ncbi:MAG: YecA family protein [gamma proteobacterium symbiont of Taylorina sp.]|nr:YecA family protein [gamma proteobacterium symbiont of Taylorina sp.]
MSSEINIELIMRSLTNVGSETTPSEAHGVLCGLLCGNNKIKSSQWKSHLAHDVLPGDLLADEAQQILDVLYNQTIVSMADNDLTFYPLLPEDENNIIILEAIAQWAQGFLMGLSLMGIREFSDYPEEVEEFVGTMASLSDADSYDLADDESDEEAIVELIEFIRMGVLLVNEEMNPVRAVSQ